MSVHFRLWGLAFAFLISTAFGGAAQEPQQPPVFPPIPVDAKEEQVRQAVQLVRAGQKLSAALHPQMIQDIVRRSRHEIGVHGWMHENLPTIGDAAKEEQLLTQSIDYLTKAVGKRPVGFRAPSWAFSWNTLDQIRKAGFLYDSSFMAMDEPYELIENGQQTGMIELPINWIADDYPYYEPQASGSCFVVEAQVF